MFLSVWAEKRCEEEANTLTDASAIPSAVCICIPPPHFPSCPSRLRTKQRAAAPCSCKLALPEEFRPSGTPASDTCTYLRPHQALSSSCFLVHWRIPSQRPVHVKLWYLVCLRISHAPVYVCYEVHGLCVPEYGIHCMCGNDCFVMTYMKERVSAQNLKGTPLNERVFEFLSFFWATWLVDLTSTRIKNGFMVHFVPLVIELNFGTTEPNTRSLGNPWNEHMIFIPSRKHTYFQWLTIDPQ
jgi:hypothetical protein